MLQIAYSEYYHHVLPLGHRFPMSKYPLIVQQLLREGTITEHGLFEPEKDNLEHIKRTHTADYITKLQSGKLERLEERKIGFPYSVRLLEREINIMNGTVAAAEKALTNGVSFNIAGGTHHAYHNRGEGFCIFNDIAVASHYLLEKNEVNKILVIDLDVHQGNGTAKIFENDPRVFTFSMHGAHNYPFKKECSDLDIGLANYTRDHEYLDLLEQALDRIIPIFRPDFIFYQSGVDVLETDKLGKMSLTMAGCKKRDELVLQTAFDNDIPLTAVMGGGYSPDIKIIVEAHCNTYRLAKEIWFS
ncbi:histone deacetylase [bacterium]|nr:histone deacetylase [bacterium]